jgi:SAM-dependent methyltransferase
MAIATSASTRCNSRDASSCKLRWARSLERSMNRHRRCVGSNSYSKELGFNPIDFLQSRQGPIHWLDICCGSGRALIEAAQILNLSSLDITITGIDLVGMFYPIPPGLTILELREEAINQVTPSCSCDLITCIQLMKQTKNSRRSLPRCINKI